jgi:two-component system nitrogen regulation response regulator NtrX
MPAETILVVDDERGILSALKGILEDEGYRAALVENGEAALQLLRERPVDLVLLDIWLPGRDGVAVLQEIKQEWPGLPVVMMSGHGTIETAVRTTKLGAYDFIEKPLSLEKTLLVLRHALEEHRLQEENRALRSRVESSLQILGETPVIQELRAQVALAAPSHGRVLITGEHGSGKELLARNIHLQSPRRHRPFVEVNCAALQEDLVESELFGHERGAFTGAVSLRKGKFELADGGTLFFDEIGDMSLKTQATILRVLENQTVERVGGTVPVRVDVRVIVATNKRLPDLIAAGLFREDLFYRLNVVPLRVPALRERREDVPLLAAHFLREFTQQTGRRPKQLSPEAVGELVAYSWPGNVRELRNLMERVVIMAPGEVVGPADLGLPPAGAATATAQGDPPAAGEEAARKAHLRQTREPEPPANS